MQIKDGVAYNRVKNCCLENFPFFLLCKPLSNHVINTYALVCNI